MLDVVKSAFKKIDSYSNKFLTCYLCINVLWVFLGIMFCNYARWFSYHQLSTTYVLMLIFNVFIILYFNIRKLVKFEKIDVFLILLIIFGTIATIFAKDVSISLFGYWKRYEGFSQLLYYYTLMYLSTIIKEDKHKKIIITSILVFGLINVFVSIIQAYDILKFIPIPFRGLKHAKGFIGHSNFFGSYMTLCLGLCIGLFLYSKDGKFKTFIKLILCMLFYTGMLLGNALSSIVGLMGIGLLIIIYFIYLIKKKEINKFLIIKHILLVLCLLSINIFLSCTNKTVLNKDVKKLTSEVSDVTKGKIDDSYGTHRLYIWKNTLKVVPKHLLHGVGVDNFSNAFGEHQLLYEEVHEKYDKAHNEYLQKLICEGIFSCITYIGMLSTIFVVSIKKILKEKNYITIALFLSFTGYSIQAFFNISVLEVAPLFWIVIGLLYNRNCKKLHNQKVL